VFVKGLGQKGLRRVNRQVQVFLVVLAMVLQVILSPAATAVATTPPTTPTTTPQATPQPTLPGAKATARARGVIVRFKAGTMPAPGVEALGVTGVQAAARADSAGLQLLTVSPDVDLSTALAQLRQDPRVAYAEPNYELRAQTPPNDPRYPEQWGLDSTAGVWAEAAWADAQTQLGTASAVPVTVAVIDTGVDTAHEDLAGRLLPGDNVITGAGAGNAADDSANGHGTHVAGIIAAETGNGIGIAGTAGTFPVSVLPVKALDANGIGTLYDIAQGIRLSADRGARVINLSLGARLPDYPVTLAEAVKYAQDRGALVVAAAGNDGDRVEGFYPAALPGVVSVGASGRDHHPASFSNYGATLMAPGVEILSTLPGNHYGTLSGTSMAAPFASGSAALLLSVYPDKGAADIAEALQSGQRVYPEGCRTYGWGTVCDNYYYVLDAQKALGLVIGGSAPYDTLEILQPQEDGSRSAHVAGEVGIMAQVSNPAKVSRVDFTLADSAGTSETVIGSVYGLAGGGTDESGLFELTWDSTTVADGRYDLMARSFDAAGGQLNSDSLALTVANQPTTGLSLQVLKPDGAAAAGAPVTIYHVYPDADGLMTYEWLSDDRADLQGKLTISGAKATDGNDYLILTQGTDPDFFYYRVVRAPAQVTLDATGAQHLTVSGRRLDGQPLVGGLLVAELLEASLPAPYEPSRVVAQNPLTALNSAGSAEVTVTPGHYNFRMVSARDAYYLVQHDVLVTDATTAVAFEPLPGDVATLQLAPDASFADTAVLLSDVGDWFWGFLTASGDGAVTVTPGQYWALIDSVSQEPAAGKEWLWTLSTPTLQLAAGENHPLAFGPPVSAHLATYPWHTGGWQPGEYAFFEMSFPDAHGNLTADLQTRAYTAATSGAGASALGFPADRVLRRARPSPASSGGSTAGSPTVGKPPADPTVRPEPAQTFAYDPVAGRFEPVAQAFAPVKATLEIRDAAGTPVATVNNSFWDFAAWFVPATQAVGTYSARVSLAAGPLGPSATGGLAESQGVPFEVQVGTPPPEPPADLTVIVLDREAAPMSWARVSLLRRAGAAYFPVPDAVTTTSDQGEARFSGLGLDQEGTYALAIYGHSLDPANPTGGSEPVFLFVPLASLTANASVTVDASSYTMHRLVLKAQDANGGALDGGYLDYFAYGYDASGAQGGALLENPDSDALVVWVPEGRYAFVADPPDSWGTPFHLIAGPVNVPAGIPVDGASGERVLVLGGAGLAGISVSGPPAPATGPSDYNVGGVAIFRSDMPAVPSPVFHDTMQMTYVLPGTYQVEAVLARQHYDGEWDYWLEGELTANTPVADGPVTLTMDANLTAHLDLDAASYPLGSTVYSTHRVEDSHGNRLVGMATNLGLVWGTAVQAWRIPGAGPILAGRPKAAGAVSPIRVQNHEEIAPFLVIRDPSGAEVFRHKDAGPDFDSLWSWHPEYGGYGSIESQVVPSSHFSTFFGDHYIIPDDARGGRYTALLQLGAGPEGDIQAEAPFDLNAAPAAPLLDSLPSPTKEPKVSVTGSAMAGATVAVGYSLDGGVRVDAGSVTAGTDGRFSLEVALPTEGTYVFTATATMNGMTGAESAPVAVVVDRTPPGAPLDLAAEGPDQTHILLTWSAPADLDVTRYYVFRDGTQVGEAPAGDSLRYLDGGLEPEHDYLYEVMAVDWAGNVSSAAAITARTGSTGDLEPPSPPQHLRAVAAPGGVVTLEWGAAADNVEVTGYRILRAVGDASPEVVGSADGGDTLTYTDTGLAASTAYAYTVTAFDAAGNDSAPSNQATATTPDPFLTSLIWRSTLTPGRLLVPGGSVTFTATGEPDRQVVARVVYQTWYDEAGVLTENLRTVKEPVVMAQDGDRPGTYRGSFTLAAGTAELTSIRAVLSDGQGHEADRTASRLPAAVGGSLKVTIVAPPVDSLNGARLVAWSGSVSSGGQAVLNGPGDYLLTGLGGASDYQVRILGRDGEQLALQDSVVVSAGRERTLSLEPHLPATLEIRVVGLADAPVAGAGVQLSRPDGRPISGTYTDEEGRTPAFTNLLSGDEVRATVRLNGGSLNMPYRDGTVETFILDVGENAGVVHLQPLPVGTLAGRVTTTQGRPLAGVVVTVSQDVDGRHITHSGQSDADGSYSISTLAGPAQVSAAKPNTRYDTGRPVSVTVPENDTTTLDLRLDAVGPGTVGVEIYTRQAGGDWIGPMEMDWRVAVHFRLKITDSVGHSFGSYWNYPVQVWGRSGDPFQVCIDGIEAGLPAQCQSVQLDDNLNATAVFRLEEHGRITGRLVDVNGGNLSAGDLAQGWDAGLYSVEGSGQKRYLRQFTGRTPEVSIPLLAAGQYYVRISLRSDQRFTERTFSVPEGGVDLGDLRLSRNASLFVGEVTATPTEATPGGMLTLRASFGLDPKYTQATTATDVGLTLDIPGGATLVPDSVTVDGQPVEATVDGAVHVHLGDLTLSPGTRKVVAYQVRLDDDVRGDRLAVNARVERSQGEGRLRDDLAPAAVLLAQVSLNVPTKLVDLRTTASGRAPAGSVVQVYDGNVLLGQAQASSGGFWRLPLTLPDRGSPTRHDLRAVVETDTGLLRSPQVTVQYDQDQVALVEFTMRQSDGRRVTFDPSQGVATFPYVVVPGNSFSFSLRFNDPSRVSDVAVFLGDGKAGGVQNGGSLSAALGWPGYDLGAVYVKYKARPKTSILRQQAPAEEQLRERLPMQLSDFEVRSSGSTPPPAENPTAPTTGWTEFSVPGRQGMTGRMEMTVGRGVSYTPTADELAEAAASGVPVYGASFDYVAGTNDLTATVTGLIPESALDSANPTGTAANLLMKALAAKGDAPTAAAAPAGDLRAAGVEVVVQVTARLTLRVGANEALNAADWTKSLIDGFGVPAKFDELQALKDQVDQNCDAGSARIYDEWADKVAQDVMIGEAIKWGLQIAGVVLAPETFGLGTLLLFGASQAIGWAMDRSIDRRIQNIKDAVAGNAECKKPEEKKEEVANPTWIWDPSGHVYEGADENRLEGVKTTVFQRAPATQAWGLWDAAWFGQENPLQTDAVGRYGWDVPPGDWQVVYEKPGYEPAQSAVLTVPPPRTEVNVGLVSLAPPAVASVVAVAGQSGSGSAAADAGYILLLFDKYMRADTLTDAAVTVSVDGQVDEFGDPVLVSGTVAPVNPVADPSGSGQSLSRRFRFTPATGAALATTLWTTSPVIGRAA